MKILILLAVIISCNQNTLEKDTKELIRLEREKYVRDSTAIDHKMQIQKARIRLEKATGKKDTLTDEEWLKKAEEDFK